MSSQVPFLPVEVSVVRRGAGAAALPAAEPPRVPSSTHESVLRDRQQRVAVAGELCPARAFVGPDSGIRPRVPAPHSAQRSPAPPLARPGPAPKAGPAPGASPPPAQRRADLPRQLPQLNLLRSLGWFALTENFVYSPLCSELYPLLTLLRARGRRSRTRQSGGKARCGAVRCGTVRYGTVRSVQYSVG